MMWVWMTETCDRLDAENWADATIRGRRPPWWRRVAVSVLGWLVWIFPPDEDEEEEYPF